MEGIELFAAIITLAGVAFTAKAKIIGWPLGIIGAALYVIIFFNHVLFAETILQALYVCIGIYGWWRWIKFKETGETHVFRISKKTVFFSIGSWLISSVLIGSFLNAYSSSDVPFIDASLAVAGIIITWQMAQRFLENWLFWIITDLVSCALFIHKHLYATAVLYFILAIIAIYGYFEWKRKLEEA